MNASPIASGLLPWTFFFQTLLLLLPTETLRNSTMFVMLTQDLVGYNFQFERGSAMERVRKGQEIEPHCLSASAEGRTPFGSC